MIPFLSCDWGTSSFRLILADSSSFQTIASTTSGEGILQTYNAWKAKGSEDANERILFFLDIIGKHIRAIEAQEKRPLDGIPVLISGMASSSIGMMPLPYQQLPFATNGSATLSKFISANEHFRHDVFLISGVRSEHDVMRGEETQLIGCIPENMNIQEDSVFIFPGTHSKHIKVQGDQATGFSTYMTGEFFELLSTKSILSAGMEKGTDLQNPDVKNSFIHGVRDAQGANLLNVCFRARTNSLFGVYSKQENFNYLSGLLIGTELQELAGSDSNHIYLCCGTALTLNYETAFDVLNLKNTYIFETGAVREAVIKGQFRIYDKFKKHA